MYRLSHNKGFVQGIRSVVQTDNDGEVYVHNPYERHALYSSRLIEKYKIEINNIKQQTQIEYRNLFQELPSLSS